VKRKKSIGEKLNLFILLIMLFLIITGCFIAIKVFFSIHENSIRENVDNASNALKEKVVDSNEYKLKDYINKSKKNIKEFINLNPYEDISYIEVEGIDEGLYIKDDLMLKTSFKINIDSLSEDKIVMLSDKEKGIFIFMKSSLSEDDPSKYIVIGIKISKNEYVEEIKGITGMDASIFAYDNRICTTVMKDGKRAVNTNLNTDIYKIIYDKEEKYQGDTGIFEKPYIVSYLPIKDETGNVVAAVFTGKSYEDMYVLRNNMIIYISALGIALLVFFYGITKFWLKKNLTNPLSYVSNGLKDVANGDYSVINDIKEASSYEMENLHLSMKIMANKIKNEKENLEIIAYTDRATGLKNRESLYKTYGELSLEDIKSSLTVLYYIDIDNMKYINCLYGQKIGDEILKKVSIALEQFKSIYSDYEVFRIGGDEFVICREGSYSIDKIVELAKKLSQVFKNAFLVKTHRISVTASIGIAYTNYCEGDKCDNCEINCKDSLEILSKKAEAAMNRVKGKGKNNFIVFNPEMNEILEKKALMEQELKLAIKNNELEMYYQPKYNIKKGEFDGFEALIRWKHLEKGFIPPDQFIPVAEETSLINEIGEFVLRTSALFINNFNEKNSLNYSVAINVSAPQFLSDGFYEEVEKIIEETGVKEEYIELELTESVFVNSVEKAIEILNRFKEKNIKIALDDFGTGYSSITYLNKLPIDILKLDKSFVDDIAMDEVDLHIVESVVKMAKSIGLLIVAEGVEKEDQYNVLKDLECDYIQGYYFSKPLPEKDALKVN